MKTLRLVTEESADGGIDQFINNVAEAKKQQWIKLGRQRILSLLTETGDGVCCKKETLLWRLQESILSTQDTEQVQLFIDLYSYISRSIAPTDMFDNRISMAVNSNREGMPSALLMDLQSYVSGGVQPKLDSGDQLFKPKKTHSKRTLIFGSIIVAVIAAIVILL